MSKDSKNQKLKTFSSNTVNLPNFVNQNNKEVFAIEGTNVIRVPFGIRFSKKQRPEKHQTIATLILPITGYNNPTPPPNVA